MECADADGALNMTPHLMIFNSKTWPTLYLMHHHEGWKVLMSITIRWNFIFFLKTYNYKKLFLSSWKESMWCLQMGKEKQAKMNEKRDIEQRRKQTGGGTEKKGNAVMEIEGKKSEKGKGRNKEEKIREKGKWQERPKTEGRVSNHLSFIQHTKQWGFQNKPGNVG